MIWYPKEILAKRSGKLRSRLMKIFAEITIGLGQIAGSVDFSFWRFHFQHFRFTGISLFPPSTRHIGVLVGRHPQRNFSGLIAEPQT
jgi:hypothetical protein